MYTSNHSVLRACAEMGVSLDEVRRWFRHILTFFGEQAGVALRQVSDDEVDLFARRFTYLAVCEAHRRGHHQEGLTFLEAWMQSDAADDVLNEAAWQAVNELFVPVSEV